jgi:hypothetical protein
MIALQIATSRGAATPQQIVRASELIYRHGAD